MESRNSKTMNSFKKAIQRTMMSTHGNESSSKRNNHHLCILFTKNQWRAD